MASTRAVTGDDVDGADLLGAAAALRWSRPDLSAAIADHVLEVAGSDSDNASWLRAAGWAVHARSETGDGRECASDVLDGLFRRGIHLLDHPAADRLRVELAVLATGADRLATARTLLTPVAVADTAPELRADALCALSRCAVHDRPSAVAGLIRRVEATWAEVGGRRGDVGSAVVSYVAASADRRAGRAAAAVDRAAVGLACLDRARGARSQSPSRHLAAGLAAEWISGLLEAGRVADAREGCGPLEPRLREEVRPSRQLALLRLTVARTVATSDADAVIGALEQAARDAARSDAPELESVCWSTLGALQEKAGHLDAATESVRRGVAAESRDTQRGRRFRAALDAIVPNDYDDGVAAVENDRTSGARVVDDRGLGPSGAAPHAAGFGAGATGAAPNGASVRDSGSWEAPEPGRGRSAGVPPAPGDGLTSTGGPWTDWSTAIARDRNTGAEPGTGTRSGRLPLDDMLGRGVDGGHSGDRTGSVDATADDGHAGSDGRSSSGGRGRSGRSGTGGVTGGIAATDSGTGAANGLGGNGLGGSHTLGTQPWSSDLVGGAAPPDRSGEPTEPLGGYPWQGWTDDSPIGYVLARSLRPHEHSGAAGRAAATGPGGPTGAASRGPGPRAGEAADGMPGEAVTERPPTGYDVDRAPDAPDPWSTGAWSTDAWSTERRGAWPKPAGWVPVDTSPPAGAGSGGRRRRAEPDDDPRGQSAPPGPPAARRPADLPPHDTRPSAGADRAGDDQVAETDSGTWLNAAVAELDRAWAPPIARTGASTPPDGPGPDAEGCVVVVDLARDGRRFAGRRAGTVVRAVADELAGRLPAGGRLRHDDSDALSVVLPGWSRSPATEWMHRTLPGVFEEVVTAEALPGAQLRAAVHDVDGPVGAQLLQRLDVAAGDRRAAPVGRPDTPEDSAPGRHGASGRTPFRAEGGGSSPAGGGRRHRRGPELPGPAAGGPAPTAPTAPTPDAAAFTDGLGLADLLAGALAAYRGI